MADKGMPAAGERIFESWNDAGRRMTVVQVPGAVLEITHVGVPLDAYTDLMSLLLRQSNGKSDPASAVDRKRATVGKNEGGPAVS